MNSLLFDRSKAGKVSRLFVLLLLTSSFQIEASSTLTPLLTVKESFVSNELASSSESGQVTSVAPGFDYQFKHSRSSLNLNYLYNTDFYSGLDLADRKSNQLDLRYEFSHIPGQWVSRITGNIRQTTSDVNSLESLNRLLNQGQTTELRTYAYNTNINKRVWEGINSAIKFNLNHADYKGQDNSESLGLDIALDNQQQKKAIFWNARINSNQNKRGGENTNISFLELGLNYIFSPKISGYIQSKSYETSNNTFTYSSALLGFKWKPGTQGFIDLSVGKRGGENTYSLGAQFKKRRLTLLMNYSEDVTSARNETIIQETDTTGFTSITRSLSIDPILQKKGSINLSLQGRRTEINFRYLQQLQGAANNGDDSRAELVGFEGRRTLSRKSSVSITAQKQNRTNSSFDEIIDYQLNYDRKLSKRITVKTEVLLSQQREETTHDKFNRKLIGITLSARF